MKKKTKNKKSNMKIKSNKKFNLKNKLVEYNHKGGISTRGIYKDCFNFISESRNYIVLSLILFFISMLVGYLFPAYGLEYIKEWIKEIVDQTQGFGYLDFFVFIFSNNVGVAFVSMIFGFFFGLVPVVIVLVNGYVIGVVMNLSVQSYSVFELWRLFPHGIFELPAIILSISLGIALSSFIIDEKPIQRLRYLFFKSIKVFFFVIIPLLLIAAIIESFLIIFVGN